MRSLIRLSFLSLRPVITTRMMLQTAVRFDFAKVSKKDEQKAEKKKEKTQAKQSLGGNINEIDLNKYDESYTAVIAAFKEQISSLRAGRLEVAALNIVQIKVGHENLPLSGLAQISSKGANTCVVSPFDSDQLDVIEKSLRLWDDALEIKRQDNSLTITQLSQGKEVKDKLVQKLKKLANDRKEELKKLRSNTQEELKKYKKLIPEDRYRTIEGEAKTLFEKRSQQIEKIEKEKEKELHK